PARRTSHCSAGSSRHEQARPLRSAHTAAHSAEGCLMIGTRWTKLRRDAQAARGRLALVVVALAASVAALATMAATSAVLMREVPRSYLGSNPASAQLELAQ